MGTTDSMGDEDYEIAASGDAGAAHTQPIEAGQIRKGGSIMIKGNPCKVVDVSTSKTGKHGHAKCHFVAVNIFNGKKAEELCPATHNANVPFVNRKEYSVMGLEDEPFISLIDDDGNVREDLKLPDQTDDDLKTAALIRDYYEDEECDCGVT